MERAYQASAWSHRQRYQKSLLLHSSSQSPSAKQVHGVEEFDKPDAGNQAVGADFYNKPHLQSGRQIE